jgi:group I intron endonuclease
MIVLLPQLKSGKTLKPLAEGMVSKMIIYKTTNVLNGKFYIGQDSKNNPKYLGSGILLSRAIEKYGQENFTKEILEVCETKEHLNERERFWINEANAKELGYNIADGGHGGNTYTDETRKRVSDLFKGREVSSETIEKRKATRQKILEQNPDVYKHTKETKIKIGEKSKGRIPSEYNRLMSSIKNSGENNPNYGKSIPWSEERKQAARGKKLSDEHRRKISEGNCGKKMSDEFVEKARQRMTGDGNPMYGRKNPHSEEYKQSIRGEGNPFHGKTHSDETKQKLSEARKSKTPEQKLERYVKFIISRTGNEPSEEQKRLKYEEYRKC